jgi:starch synthase (maltosyl-transferring)
MRIDLVITELNMGGAERCCTELALFLANRGHAVRIIALGPRPKPPSDALLQKLSASSVKTHFLGASSNLGLPAVLWKLRRLIRTDRPKLVQSFLWHANVLTAAVAPSLKIPLVGGVRVAEPRVWRHRIGGWAARRMARVVCVSQDVADWCVAKELVDPKRIVVIPNGVELHDMPPIDARFQEARPILLFVGRLEHQKGIDILIQQAPQLLADLPTHQLVLIGDGSFRSAAEELARRPELLGRVHCLGQRSDVRDWMARAQLLLLPTRYEGMPNVVLEAMAEGLPLVTMRVEGVHELLSDHLPDQSVPAEDWDGFFELTKRLANDPFVRNRLSAFNRQRIEQCFTLEQQLQRYETLYESIFERDSLSQTRSRPA